MRLIVATRARGTDAAYQQPSRIRCGFERTKDVPSRVHQHDRNPADRHGGQHGGNSLDLDGIRSPVHRLRSKPVGHDHRRVLEREQAEIARTSFIGTPKISKGIGADSHPRCTSPRVTRARRCRRAGGRFGSKRFRRIAKSLRPDVESQRDRCLPTPPPAPRRNFVSELNGPGRREAPRPHFRGPAPRPA